ncbi:hypothetical protein ACTFIU_006223 [Dictyostelium citrinum]
MIFSVPIRNKCNPTYSKAVPDRQQQQLDQHQQLDKNSIKKVYHGRGNATTTSPVCGVVGYQTTITSHTTSSYPVSTLNGLGFGTHSQIDQNSGTGYSFNSQQLEQQRHSRSSPTDLRGSSSSSSSSRESYSSSSHPGQYGSQSQYGSGYGSQSQYSSQSGYGSQSGFGNNSFSGIQQQQQSTNGVNGSTSQYGQR